MPKRTWCYNIQKVADACPGRGTKIGVISKGSRHEFHEFIINFSHNNLYQIKYLMTLAAPNYNPEHCPYIIDPSSRCNNHTIPIESLPVI